MQSWRIVPSVPLARTFFRWALGMGFLYATINAPFGVNDERGHLPRVYEFSTGQLVTSVDAQGAYHLIPKAYRDLIHRYSDIRKSERSRVVGEALVHDLTTVENLHKFERLSSSAPMYTPVAYALQIPAVWLARALRLPALWHLYFARLASVFCFALLASWSVALADKLQWPFFALGLMPMTMTQAAGVSGDAITNGVCFVLLALIVRGALREQGSPSRRELMAIATLSALATLCKPTYALISLALPSLHWEGPRATVRRWAYPALTLGIAGLILWLWYYLNRGPPSDPGPGPSDQVDWLLTHPTGTLRVVLATLFAQGDDLLIQFVVLRDNLARQMRFIGGALSALYVELLIVLSYGVLRQQGERTRAVRRVAGWLALAGLATVAAVFFAMYALGPVAAPQVNGVQGRYFTPVAPAFLAALGAFGRPTLARWLTRKGGRAVFVAVLVLNAVCLLSLIGRYYAPADLDWPY